MVAAEAFDWHQRAAHSIATTPWREDALATYHGISTSIESDVHSSLNLACWGPANVIPIVPLVSRDLIEYCLSLSRRHKWQYHSGEVIDKASWRYAYAGRLPNPTLTKLSQPIASVVAEQFVRNNSGTIEDLLLGPESRLRAYDVVAAGGLADIFQDARRLAQHSGYLVSATGLELWLRNNHN